MNGYYLVRAKNAGIFIGTVIKIDKDVVTMKNTKRVFKWSGACSISQLAQDGTTEPENCYISVAVDEIIIYNVLEIIKCTDKAKETLEAVAVWKA